MNHYTNDPLSQLERVYKLIDKPDVTLEEIYDAVRDFFRKSEYRAPLPSLQIGGLYRVSILGPSESHKPSLSRFGPPPSDKTGPGRCNWPKEPIFYCSNENGVPVLEVRTKQDSVIAMSRWIARVPPHKDSSFISISPLILGLDRVINTFGDNNHTLRRFRDIDYAKMSPHVKKIDEYLGRKFAEDNLKVPNIYKFTSSVSKCLLNDMKDSETGQSADGLMYPSIQSKFTGINLAIQLDFLNTKLSLDGVAIYHVKNYTPDEPPYTDNSKPFFSMAGIRSLTSLDRSGTTVWKEVSAKNADKRFDLSPATQTHDGGVPLTFD